MTAIKDRGLMEITKNGVILIMKGFEYGRLNRHLSHPSGRAGNEMVDTAESWGVSPAWKTHSRLQMQTYVRNYCDKHQPAVGALELRIGENLTKSEGQRAENETLSCPKSGLRKR